jgi:exosortase
VRAKLFQQTFVATAGDRYLGIATLAIGGIIHLAVQVLSIPLLDYVAWLSMVGGILLACGGRAVCRRATPALLFSFFLFPLPMTWLNAVALRLQELVSQSAAALINVWTVCHQRGNMLYIAGLDEPFAVAAECSGLRQVMIFLALSSLLACFLPGSVLRRALLILAGVPIAILVNVIRVVALIGIARLGNMSWIEGMCHDLPLIMTLPLGAILLWFCYLKLSERRGVSPPVEVGSTSAFNREPDGVPLLSSATCRSTFSYLLIPLSLLVGSQFMLHRHLQGAIKNVPEVDALVFEQLPWTLNGWIGQPHPQADVVAKQTDFADATVTRAYVNPAGQAAAVHLVYSRTGRDRDHHPEICLGAAAGALEIRTNRREIDLEGGTPFQGRAFPRYAVRTCFQTRHLQRTTIYYWHYTLIPENKESQTFLQRLYCRYRGSWPSLTVQVQTNQPEASVRQAIETSLLPELDQWLATHLPASAQVGADQRSIRLAIDQ